MASPKSNETNHPPLIGTIKTDNIYIKHIPYSLFQPLIGTIKTDHWILRNMKNYVKFQPLIGTIKTYFSHTLNYYPGPVSTPYRDDKNYIRKRV